MKGVIWAILGTILTLGGIFVVIATALCMFHALGVLLLNVLLSIVGLSVLHIGLIILQQLNHNRYVNRRFKQWKEK